jgi:hypothetical protein
LADIFEEVEEGLRQEKLTVAWKKYGIFAYLAVALIIGGVGLNEYLQYSKARTIETNASKLEAALAELDERNYDAAAAGLVELVESDVRVSPVAGHYLARVRLDANGDEAATVEVLMRSAGAVETPTEKLALIKAAYLKADTSPRSELETLLAPLSGEESAFGALALELIAAKALQEGDVEFARKQFTFLRLAQDVPPGVLTRAEQALASMPPLVLDETVAPPAEDIAEPIVEETTPVETAPAEETGE